MWLAVILVLVVLVLAGMAAFGGRERLTVMPGVPLYPTDLDVPRDFYGPRYSPVAGCDSAALAQPARSLCGVC